MPRPCVFGPSSGQKRQKPWVFHENGRKPGRSQALFGEKNLFPEMAQNCPGCCFLRFSQAKRTRARTQSLDNARGVQAKRVFRKVHWQWVFFEGVSRHFLSSGWLSCLCRCRVSARHRLLCRSVLGNLSITGTAPLLLHVSARVHALSMLRSRALSLSLSLSSRSLSLSLSLSHVFLSVTCTSPVLSLRMRRRDALVGRPRARQGGMGIGCNVRDACEGLRMSSSFCYCFLSLNLAGVLHVCVGMLCLHVQGRTVGQ